MIHGHPSKLLLIFCALVACDLDESNEQASLDDGIPGDMIAPDVPGSEQDDDELLVGTFDVSTAAGGVQNDKCPNNYAVCFFYESWYQGSDFPIKPGPFNVPFPKEVKSILKNPDTARVVLYNYNGTCLMTLGAGAQKLPHLAIGVRRARRLGLNEKGC